MQNNAITVSNVSKSYKCVKSSIDALKEVSFDVAAGEIFGLTGPDGSGKTTMMRIATSLMIPSSGTVHVNGFDLVRDYRKIRNSLGYMPARFSLYQDLTVEENLNFFAKVFGVKISDNIELVKDIYSQIEPFKDRLAGKLSGGMKQKLALCCALIHRPSILILDEPTTGVDPVSRQELWEILRNMKALGITILASTPFMDEASLCDRIAFIVKGKILKTDTPEKMIESFSKKILHIEGRDMFKLLDILRRNPDVESAYAFGDKNHVVLKNKTAGNLHDYLSSKGYGDVKISEAKAVLEDCFMNLNGGHD